MEDDRSFPTMVIPLGTEISVNDRNQLAIKTPGNLVIQNPGTYSVIECTSGSIRIEAGVKVDTVSVNVADTCCVAGMLTAWHVKAKKMVLEKGSQAFVMLLQTDSLELDKQARLVGNFGSEKELYLMLSRFNPQLRSLPQALAPGDVGVGELPMFAAGNQAPPPVGQAAGRAPSVVMDPLSEDAFSQVEQDLTAQDDAETVALMRVSLQRELLRPELPLDCRHAFTDLLAALQTEDLSAIEPYVKVARVRLPQASSDARDAFERFERFLAVRRPWLSRS